MWVLAELFEQLPEVGDLEKPKLVFFFDEAHLLFDDATKSFLDSVDAHRSHDPLEGRRRVLRHAAADRPAGARCSASSGHACSTRSARSRPEDADALKKTVRTYPTSRVLRPRQSCSREVGTGEAVVTILSEKGVPTPVVHTRLRAPRSSMTASSSGVASVGEGLAALRRSTGRGSRRTARPRSLRSVSRRRRRRRRTRRRRRPKPKAAKPAGNALTDFLGSRQGKTLQREIVRGAFSLLKKRM